MNLSPFILCLFLLGLAPGVLSLLSPVNSRERARDRASASILLPPPPSLRRVICLNGLLFALPFSRPSLPCSRPRSDGGGGVDILAGVRQAGLSGACFIDIVTGSVASPASVAMVFVMST